MPRWSDDESCGSIDEENYPDMVDIMNRIEAQLELEEEFPPEVIDDENA